MGGVMSLYTIKKLLICGGQHSITTHSDRAACTVTDCDSCLKGSLESWNCLVVMTQNGSQTRSHSTWAFSGFVTCLVAGL